MKKTIFTGVLILLNPAVFAQLHSQVELAFRSPLEINGIIANTDRIGLFEKYELTFEVRGTWDNPFDPDQIRVDAIIIQPGGSRITVPGFFYQAYLQNPANEPEVTGDPVWKIRFTPEITGNYTCFIRVLNGDKEIRSETTSFECTDYHTNHGFLRVSRDNPLYFEFEDGTPFIGIAADRIQADQGGFYRRFAGAGGNFNRLFLTNGKYDIQELTADPSRTDRGLGKINLENAWNLDQLLESGENLGIYHMLTLTNQYNFNHLWNRHTYNKANGGILDSKNEYFTSEPAMAYFEQYLRYMVARYGYSTAIFSWDLWNEYSAMGVDTEKAIPWHLRMAHFLESLDVFNHVIHTNDGAFNGDDRMHGLREMEIVSTNAYVLKDISYLASLWTKRMIDTFNKPYILTEYGMGHNPPPGAYGTMDPERRMVHNGLWSPLISGSASTGMPWEANWLNDPVFFDYIRAVHAVVRDIPFSKRSWKTVQITSFKFRSPHEAYYGDVIVEGWPGNFHLDRGHAPEIYRIDATGRVSNQESLNAVLTGSREPGRKNESEVTFAVEYPVAGRFIIFIPELRDTLPTPQLTAMIDGKRVIRKDLNRLNSEKYHPVMYNQYFTIEVPAGKHTIHIANTGGGRILTSFELQNFLLKNGPDLEVRGLTTDDYIMLWFKNQKYTVFHEQAGMPCSMQPEGILEIHGIENGTWLAEWVNTVDAAGIRTELVHSSEQRLILSTPAIEKSMAVRLHKL